MHINLLNITHRFGIVVATLLSTSLTLPVPHEEITPEFFYPLIDSQRMTITQTGIFVDGNKLSLSKADVCAFSDWLLADVEYIETRFKNFALTPYYVKVVVKSN